MSYGGNTKKYKIPYPVFGNYIQSSEEEKRNLIVENQLYGAIRAHSRGHGVIREGTYTVYPSGTSYYVQLTEVKTQNLPTLEAFINQVYVSTDSPLTWNSLSVGTNYLWARLVETTSFSSLQYGDAITDSGLTSTVPDDGLLLATIILSGTGYTFSSSPTGKTLIPTLTDHTGDSLDPHGATLGQTTLISSGITVLGNIVVTGNTQLDGNLTIGGTLTAASSSFSSVTVTGTLGATVANLGTVTQASGITYNGTVTFRQNVTVSSGITVDGRDISADGATLDAHVANVSNPHSTTAAQAGALPLAGGAMTGNIIFSSGISIDGVDPSVLVPLFNGSAITTQHTHVQSSGFNLPFRYLYASPQYANAVVSGNAVGTFAYSVDSGNNAASWSATGPSPLNKTVVHRFVVPEDFNGWGQIDLLNKAGSPAMVNVYLQDTTGANVALSNAYGLTNASWTTTTIGVLSSGATWTKGSMATLKMDMVGAAGQTVSVSDLKLKYVPY